MDFRVFALKKRKAYLEEQRNFYVKEIENWFWEKYGLELEELSIYVSGLWIDIELEWLEEYALEVNDMQLFKLAKELQSIYEELSNINEMLLS